MTGIDRTAPAIGPTVLVIEDEPSIAEPFARAGWVVS